MSEPQLSVFGEATIGSVGTVLTGEHIQWALAWLEREDAPGVVGERWRRYEEAAAPLRRALDEHYGATDWEEA